MWHKFKKDLFSYYSKKKVNGVIGVNGIMRTCHIYYINRPAFKWCEHYKDINNYFYLFIYLFILLLFFSFFFFFCKHENALNSMGFLTPWNYFWSLTVYILTRAGQKLISWCQANSDYLTKLLAPMFSCPSRKTGNQLTKRSSDRTCLVLSCLVVDVRTW